MSEPVKYGPEEMEIWRGYAMAFLTQELTDTGVEALRLVGETQQSYAAKASDVMMAHDRARRAEAQAVHAPDRAVSVNASGTPNAVRVALQDVLNLCDYLQRHWSDCEVIGVAETRTLVLAALKEIG